MALGGGGATGWPKETKEKCDAKCKWQIIGLQDAPRDRVVQTALSLQHITVPGLPGHKPCPGPTLIHTRGVGETGRRFNTTRRHLIIS